MSPGKRGSAAKKSGRAMPEFSKPSPGTTAAFATAVDGLSGIEHRTMFGYPSVFLNGNMLACIFQDRIMVRLSERDRAEAMAAAAKPFEPMPGRAMKEYVELPPGIAGDPAALRRWIGRGRTYVEGLPKKAKKKSK
jgi:TfoX/Sxy family transcriptional regulator of competence genes